MAQGLTWPDLYPIFLRLTGEAVLVVGAGAVGTRKVSGLLAAGARVTVVAPEATDEIGRLAGEGKVRWERRPFEESDVKGHRLVFAATPDRAVSERVERAAAGAGLLVNVADTPDLCSFYLPSVLERGPLKVAVSTSGACPAYARELRRRLERRIGKRTDGFVELLGRMRERVRQKDPAAVMELSLAMVGSGAERLWDEGDEEGAERILERIAERK